MTHVFGRNKRTPETPQTKPSDEPGAVEALLARYGVVAEDELYDYSRRRRPEVQQVADAVQAGDWSAAQAYLLAAKDNDDRCMRVQWLAEVAAEDDAWLAAWRAAEPQNPDAAVIDADGLVTVAWQIRSAGRAANVTDEQWQGFARVLTQADDAVDRAIALSPPTDIAPLVVAAKIARGKAWPNDEYRKLWAETVVRDPHSLYAHYMALQYWSQKWYGSHEAMFDFAEAAVAAAPAGSLLPFLLLAAHWEKVDFDGLDEVDYCFENPELGRAIDLTLAAVGDDDRDDFWLVRARGFLAWAMANYGRSDEALRQYAILDPRVHGPYSYRGNPVRAFATDRDFAAIRVLNR